jgi:hypothetical protein
MFAKVSVVTMLLATAMASPMASTIVKRGEGVHLVNCGNTYSAVIVRDTPLSPS